MRDESLEAVLIAFTDLLDELNRDAELTPLCFSIERTENDPGSWRLYVEMPGHAQAARVVRLMEVERGGVYDVAGTRWFRSDGLYGGARMRVEWSTEIQEEARESEEHRALELVQREIQGASVAIGRVLGICSQVLNGGGR